MSAAGPPHEHDEPPQAALHGAVLRWYAASARDLPWRRTDATPWGVFVSEIMLQQTPVARVEPVWRAWLARWPTPAALAAEPPGEAVRAWGRLGYPRRALRLHEAATAMLHRHDGTVPETAAALLALPGVGAYTAAAVASFGYGRRACVVDTNVRRVLARVVSGAAQAAPAVTAAEMSLAGDLLPEDADTARRWNVGVMELGALVCTARAPRCADCPVAALCAWRGAGYPAHVGAVRRAQAWHGTDRQVRGTILAILRSSERPVAGHVLDQAVAATPRNGPPAGPAQGRRCLHSLIADGLVEPLDRDVYQLPGGRRIRSLCAPT